MLVVCMGGGGANFHHGQFTVAIIVVLGSHGVPISCQRSR